MPKKTHEGVGQPRVQLETSKTPSEGERLSGVSARKITESTKTTEGVLPTCGEPEEGSDGGW